MQREFTYCKLHPESKSHPSLGQMSSEANMQNFIGATNLPRTFMLLLGIPLAVSAGIYVAMKYTQKKRSQFSTHQMPLITLHGGQLVLQRLIDYHGTQVKLDKAEANLERLLKENTAHPDIKKLQRAVARLEVSTRRTKAAKMLEDAIVRAEKAGNLHEAYEFEMLYVEMLIYMGNPEGALKPKCLNDQKITDARRPIFKAISYIMLGKDDEGKKCWEEFKEIREILHLSDILREDGLDNLANNFDEFKRVAELLKQDSKNTKNVKAA